VLTIAKIKLTLFLVMEANPLVPPSVEQPLPPDKKESRKRKRKNVENLGTFIVEKKPKNKEVSLDLAAQVWRSAKKEKNASDKIEAFGFRLSEADKTPELDGEAPLEHLSRVETLAINQNLGKVREEEVASERETLEPDSPEAEQIEVVEEFLALVRETGDPELAAQQVAENRGLDPVLIPQAEILESILEESQLPATDLAGAGEIDTNQSNEGEISLDSQEYDAPDPVLSPTVNGTGNTGQGGNGGGAQPPNASSAAPAGGGVPFNYGNVNVAPNYAAASPNVNPNTVSNADPNTISTNDAYYYERKALGRGLLVGGIVGYLIGRRRGRIKTEKKLLPVQKKLEKEVKGLQSRLIDNEYALRRAVASRNELQAAQKHNKKNSSEPATRPELQRNVIAEVLALHGQKVPLERIGHVIVAAEAVTIAAKQETPSLEKPKAERMEKRRPEVERVEKLQTPKPLVEKPRSERVRIEKPKVEKLLSPKLQSEKPRVENPQSPESSAAAEKQAMTMRRSDLLELSETVMVDGTNLRQIYETHLVGERGLRRLVSEHLRGGNIQRALRAELVERQIDFERDPFLRDRARASVSGGAGKSAVGNLIQEPAAVSIARQAAVSNSAQSQSEDVEDSSQIKKSHFVDISLVTTILILLALIAYLALRTS
jgi:hypothetical protein